MLRQINLKTGLTLKTHQMFFMHTLPQEFKNVIVTGHCNDYYDAIIFKRLCFQNVFCLNENEKLLF